VAGGPTAQAVLEQIIPDVEDLLSLSDVRARTKKLQNQVEALKRVPVPASDIDQKVRTYVERLPMPSIGGIAAGETLTVQWPTGLHTLMAFLQPEILAERLVAEINRIANTPCPLASASSRSPNSKRRSIGCSAQRRPSSSPPVRRARLDACLGSYWA
jgi:hypothetical protein